MNDVPSPTQFASQRSAVSGLAPLVAIVFCGFLAVGAPLPALSLYVHDELGFSSFTVGWVIGIQSVVTVLSRHYAGTLSDHHGPRWIVLRGLPLAVLAACCYLASALLPDARCFALLPTALCGASLAPLYGRPPDARLPA